MTACAWCRGEVSPEARADAKFCSKRCRQSSWRFAVERAAAAADRPMRFAYADPPYPGKAHYYPEQREVDHAELIRRLSSTWTDGWALSTSAVALAGVLALCPPGVRVLSWVKNPRGGSAWEAVILSGGRRHEARGVPDALVYRGRYHAFPGAMVGMKPPQFSEWVFAHLGACAGDSLDDLFPGSGAVSLAWRRYTSAAAAGDASPGDRVDASRGAGVDPSPQDPRDASRRSCATPRRGDASPRARGVR